MSDLATLTSNVKASFDKQDYSTCIKILPLIKVELAKHNLLVPIVNKKHGNPGDLIISRSILEIGALSAINLSNLSLFEKYIIELKPFYNLKNDFFISHRSANESKLFALFLLLLLIKGEISQFHIELLALSSNNEKKLSDNNGTAADDPSQIEDSPYLNYPIKIERWLMEGSYDKVWNLINNPGNNVSDFKEFLFFNKSLIHTLRNEVSKCLNVSYDGLPISNAKNLLFFQTEKELLDFIKDNSGITSTWKIENSTIYFPVKDEDFDDVGLEVGPEDEGAGDEDLVKYNEQGFGDESQFDKEEHELKSSEYVIQNVLNYATVMETIV